MVWRFRFNVEFHHFTRLLWRFYSLLFNPYKTSAVLSSTVLIETYTSLNAVWISSLCFLHMGIGHKPYSYVVYSAYNLYLFWPLWIPRFQCGQTGHWSVVHFTVEYTCHLVVVAICLVIFSFFVIDFIRKKAACLVIRTKIWTRCVNDEFSDACKALSFIWIVRREKRCGFTRKLLLSEMLISSLLFPSSIFPLDSTSYCYGCITIVCCAAFLAVLFS